MLLRNGTSPHNGLARKLNCRGFGTCGTCAVRIDGPVPDPGPVEQWRLGFPPHQKDSGLRLACQVVVKDDLRVTKHEGFWGHRVDAPRRVGDRRRVQEHQRDGEAEHGDTTPSGEAGERRSKAAESPK